MSKPPRVNTLDKPIKKDDAEDKRRAEWERLLKNGYGVSYQSPDGMKTDHIDFTKEACPNSRRIPLSNFIRRCTVLPYYSPVIEDGRISTRNEGYPCPVRGWMGHWKDCPYKGD